MDILFTSVVKRPYVFAFLVAFVVLSVKRWGWKRSLLWLLSGYVIAWISEYSSINNGFPYGEYHYVYENLSNELMLGGVPVFDSLSYPFLIFAGYSTAEFIMRDTRHETKDKGPIAGSRVSGLVSRVLLGAALTMLLDVIIDPIATMGDKWFLGKIHFYAHPGWYFGVPLTNFGGWFLVPLAVILFNMRMWNHFPGFFCERDAAGEERLNVVYPLFYLAIALFNIVITFSVGEWKLGISSSVLLLAVAGFVMRAFRNAPARRTKVS